MELKEEKVEKEVGNVEKVCGCLGKSTWRLEEWRGGCGVWRGGNMEDVVEGEGGREKVTRSFMGKLNQLSEAREERRTEKRGEESKEEVNKGKESRGKGEEMKENLKNIKENKGIEDKRGGVEKREGRLTQPLLICEL